MMRIQESSAQACFSSDTALSNCQPTSPEASSSTYLNDQIQTRKKVLHPENSMAIHVMPTPPQRPAQNPPFRDSARMQHCPGETHPDIYLSSNPRCMEQKKYSTEVFAVDRPENLGCRTRAWVQEQKVSGKLVGEKLSSIQRKLKSLLTQTNKESAGNEVEVSSRKDKSSSRPCETHSYLYSNDEAIQPKHCVRSCSMPSELSFHQSYRPVGVSSLQPSGHPFGTAANVSERDESPDAYFQRDNPNTYLAQRRGGYWENSHNPHNCYSNNIASFYDFDKLGPKEAIGKPCNDDKQATASKIKFDDSPVNRWQNKTSKWVEAEIFDESLPTRKSPSVNLENKAEDSQGEDVLNTRQTSDYLPYATECSDPNDVYKSSSESGRGTMHSSMHGFKDALPCSSGISAGSNLDTSLDSDHSTSGAIWDHPKQGEGDDEFSNQVSMAKHIYENPKVNIESKQSTDKVNNDSYDKSECHRGVPPVLSPSPTATRNKSFSNALTSGRSYCQQSEQCQDMPAPCLSQVLPKCSAMTEARSMSHLDCRHHVEKLSHCSQGCPSAHSSSHLARNQIAVLNSLGVGEPDLSSNTPGPDVESLIDGDDYSSDLSGNTSTLGPSEVGVIRKQLDDLETMYSEILHLLGIKGSCKDAVHSRSFEVSHNSRRRVNDSHSSQSRRAVSHGRHNFSDRSFPERSCSKYDRRSSPANKRLQRLESHVVTLARSVAHLSSEMRSQHVLVQELENVKQDINWVQERLRLMQLAQGCNSSNGVNRNHQLAMPRDWDNFHKEVLELLNPCRAKKLLKFFGDEPPLIRQFLKRLGYEKYASNFEAEKIGIKELPYLTEDKLQKMGIPMGPRIRILQEANACCQQNQYKVYII